MTSIGSVHAGSSDLPPLTSPASTSGLLEVFRRRYLLRLLVKREISARYQGSVLGMVWSYVVPLSQFCIYYFVMGVLMGLHKNVENFAIHIFCGLIIVHFFNETVNAGTRSIVRNKALVVKMALPREMFPVASMLVSAFHIGPQVVIMTVFCLALGWAPDPIGILSFVVAIVLTMAMGTAAALMFSAANVFMRDVGSAVNILTNLVRFGVPMIYPFTVVEDRFGSAANLYLWNPLADAVLLMQRAFWVGSTDHPEVTIETNIPDNLATMSFLTLGIALTLLVIGQVIFSRLENKIPERL
jgi:ABC-2 type transport system permease protein